MTYTFDFSALPPYWETLLSGCWLSRSMTTLWLIFGLGIALFALRSRYRLLGRAVPNAVLMSSASILLRMNFVSGVGFAATAYRRSNERAHEARIGRSLLPRASSPDAASIH